MSDNRTNEQLAERLRQFAESQAMDFNNPHIAMTLNEVADRLTGTITEAQVEAAAKIIRRASLETTADPGDFWSDCYEGERERWRDAARAALVAAAGVAPTVQQVSESDLAEVRQHIAAGLVAAGIKPYDPAYYKAIDAVLAAFGGESR